MTDRPAPSVPMLLDVGQRRVHHRRSYSSNPLVEDPRVTVQLAWSAVRWSSRATIEVDVDSGTTT